MSTYNKNIFDSLDNDEHEEQLQQQQQEKTNDYVKKELEESENKTSITTTVVSQPTITTGSELEEEVQANIPLSHMEQKQEVIFACYKCNITKVMLLPVITEEQNRAYCCIKCVSEAVLDSHFSQFINDSSEYSSSFHNYIDKKKA